MRRRALGILVAATAMAGFFGSTSSPAAPAWVQGRAGVLCSWGGNPAAATGTVSFKPGVTNTPSTKPLKILAQGAMQCSNGWSGDVIFDGVIRAGGTCAFQIFEGKIKGLPGVDAAFGPGAAGVVHEFLYDKDGNIVGADQPQVLSGLFANGSKATDCNTEDGFTETVFSSTVEIWS